MGKEKGKRQSLPSTPEKHSKKSPAKAERNDVVTPTPRKRLRAAQFARKSSVKRRTPHAHRPTSADDEPDADTEPTNIAQSPIASKSIEKVLRDVQKLMKSTDRTPENENSDLRKAIRLADEAFRDDITDSSSSSSEDELPPPTAPVTKSVKDTPKKTPVKLLTSSKKNNRSVKKDKRVADKDESYESDLEASFKNHPQDIEALKKDDPEFYKFLEENDASLLDVEDLGFDDDEEDQEILEAANQSRSNGSDEEGRVELRHKSPRKQAEQEQNAKAVETNTGGEESETDDGTEGEKNAKQVDSVYSEEKEGHKNIREPGTNDSKSGVEVSSSFAEDSEDSEGVEDEVVSEEQASPGKTSVKNDIRLTSLDADRTGYSSDDIDDEEDDEKAEAEAAAEAGIAVQIDADTDEEGDDASSEGDNDAEKTDEEGDGASDGMDVVNANENEGAQDGTTSKGVTIVDLKYLRNLKELLHSKRASEKACKDLMKIFRAGRDILPDSVVRTSQRKKTSSRKTNSSWDAEISKEDVEEADEDEYAEEGAFTAGNVKFTSSKAYQQAMNLSIIGMQDAFDRMLEKPSGKNAEASLAKWDPTESSRWASLQSLFNQFVHELLALCGAMEDAKTLRFILKRLQRLAPYTKDNAKLLKRVTRVAVRIWSSEVHHVSQETRLRAYLLISRFAHVSNHTETVLRSCCNAFVSNISSVCNPKTLKLIHFAVACMVELFGIDMGASYTTAFSYLREMAVSLRSVLVSKDGKEDIERVHNWSFVNELRLWSKVLGKYGREDELQPLVYPYVQVALGVMRLHATPRTYPLRLQIASYLTDVVGETGTLIPVVPHVLGLLRCSELRKRPGHSSSKILEWRGLLRVSDDIVKTKPFLSGIVNGVVMEISKFFAKISKHVAFPELSYVAECGLRKVAKEVQVTEWKTKLMSLAQKLRMTSDIIVEARAKADFSPHGAVSSEGMLACVPGLARSQKMPIERFYEAENTRYLKEGAARDATNANKRQAEDMEESGEDEEESGKQRTIKKAKASKGKKVKIERPRLAVPKVDNDDDDERDQFAELNLDSDESDGE